MRKKLNLDRYKGFRVFVDSGILRNKFSEFDKKKKSDTWLGLLGITITLGICIFFSDIKSRLGIPVKTIEQI